MKTQCQVQGFTVIELMVTLFISAIVVAIAAPLFMDMQHNMHVKSAAEKFAHTIQLVHSEAIKRHADFHLSYQSGTNWCFGLDDTAPCDCSVANDCQVDSVEVVSKASDFNKVTLNLTGFTGNDIMIEGVRGLVSNVGSAAFAISGKTVQVAVNAMGRVSMCSNTITGYSSC